MCNYYKERKSLNISFYFKENMEPDVIKRLSELNRNLSTIFNSPIKDLPISIDFVDVRTIEGIVDSVKISGLVKLILPGWSSSLTFAEVHKGKVSYLPPEKVASYYEMTDRNPTDVQVICDKEGNKHIKSYKGIQPPTGIPYTSIVNVIRIAFKNEGYDVLETKKLNDK